MAAPTDSAAKPRRQCDIARHENYLQRNARTCEQCGNSFTQGRLSAKQLAAGHVQRYCSRACKGASTRVYPNKNEAKKAASIRRSVAKYGPRERPCKECGSVFTANILSTFACSPCREAKYKVPRQRGNCGECGIEVVGTKSKKFCLACRRKRAAAAYEAKHGKVKKHRQRAKRFGVQYEPINPIAVFDRDSWRCQVCGVKTPKRLRGTTDKRAPELDHRTPMALGGPHTWANVQCCCRACNIAKGGTQTVGQLQLFAA